MTRSVRASIRSVLCTALITLTWQSFMGQSTPTSIGKPTGATVFPIEHGFVDLANGNVHLEIPIEGYAQRGDISVPATFVYDSSIWAANINPTTGAGSWSPGNVPDNTNSYVENYGIYETGWRFSYLPNNAYSYTAGSDFVCDLPSGSPYIKYYGPTISLFPNEGFTWYDLKGTAHTFVIHTVDIKDYGCTNSVPYQDTPTGSAYATDGSGYYAAITNYQDPTIWNPNGTQVASAFSPQGVQVDRNGNCLACVVSGDTLGRNPITVSSGGNDSQGRPVEYMDVITTGGAKARYTITYQSIQLSTNFGNPKISEFTGSAWTIDSIGLPDGTSYSFSYEGSYGELIGVTLPHGGLVGLSYTSTAQSGTLLPARWLSQHVGSNGTTTFALGGSYPGEYSGPGGTVFGGTVNGAGVPCNNYDQIVTNESTQTGYFFQVCADGAKEYEEDYYQTVGKYNAVSKLLKSYDYTHLCSTDACPGYTQGGPKVYQWINPTGVTQVLSDSGLTSDIQYSYNTPGNGLPTTVKQWDFYAATPASLPDSPPGLPTREIDQVLSYNVNGALFPTSTTYKNSAGITVSELTYAYDESGTGRLVTAPSTTPNLTTPTGNRGNLTTLTMIDPAQGSTANRVSSLYYDTAGKIQSVSDPNHNVTSFVYDPTDAFPITITGPKTGSISHVVSKTYDSNTGQITSYTDQNNQKVTYNYDTIGRLQSTLFGKTTLSTISHPTVNETDVSLQQSATAAISVANIVDGYGRKSQSIAGGVGGVSQETTYDAHGRLYSVTNPHIIGSPASTDGTSYWQYDELGRLLNVQNPKGQSKGYSYLGNTVTITDPLGHQRKQTFDSFGDLTSVVEPDLTGALNWTTAYGYNWMGKVTTVNQKGGTTASSNWRTRTFNYDGFGDLTYQNTQEAGTLLLQYDNDGNLKLTQNQNASNNTVNFYYDALNRITSKVIAGGPTYTYTYDAQDSSADPYGMGQLTGTTNGSNVQTIWTHDAMGRVASTGYCLPSNCTFNYTAVTPHDYLGNLTSLTYPDGRQISWTYNQLNQPISETYAQWGSTQVNTPYVSNFSYAPPGQLQQATLGNGVQVAATYDANQNLSSLAAVANGSPIMEKIYTWDLNAANLLSVQDFASGRTQTYQYDPLDRLASMSDSGSTATACNANLPSIASASQTYTIDAWGNLKQYGSAAFSQPTGTNNQISGGTCNAGGSGYQYDCAGNQTNDGLGNNYQYRADGLMSASNSVNYTYDALGQRVRKDASSSSNEYFYLGGTLMAMRNPSTGAWTDRIYGPFGALATVPGTPAGSPVYRLVDHLGSLNYTTDSTGKVTGTTSALPFGQLTTNTANDNFSFTDDERDSENGSDATLFRHFASTEGRWLAADPSNGSYSLSDPQSLNRYAYLNNRPMNATDRLGLDDDDDDDDDSAPPPPTTFDDGTTSTTQNLYDDDGNLYGSITSSIVFPGAVGSDAANSTGTSSTDAAPSFAEDVFVAGTMALGNIPELGGIANGVLAGYYASKGQYGQAAAFTAASVYSFLGGVGGSEIVEGAEALRAANLLGETAIEAGEQSTTRLARVVNAEFANTATLGAPGAEDAFVTSAGDIAGIESSAALAERLTLVDKGGNFIPGARAVIEFDAPAEGLASPVFRNNPGFIGGGRTAGGASEYVLPNLPINTLRNVTVKIIP